MAFSIEFCPNLQKASFCNTKNGEKSDRTELFYSFDGERLFFRFLCKEEYFCPKHKNYNDPLYEGDIVELMISLGDKNRYLETETNAFGADYCVLIDNIDGEGDIKITKIFANPIKSKVKMLEEGWSCDIIIEVAKLYEYGFTDKFYFNAHRQDFDADGTLNLYSLCPTYCDTFHKPESFSEATLRR